VGGYWASCCSKADGWVVAWSETGAWWVMVVSSSNAEGFIFSTRNNPPYNVRGVGLENHRTWPNCGKTLILLGLFVVKLEF